MGASQSSVKVSEDYVEIVPAPKAPYLLNSKFSRQYIIDLFRITPPKLL